MSWYARSWQHMAAVLEESQAAGGADVGRAIDDSYPYSSRSGFDYTDRLGIQKMPPGYLLIGLDSGHFMWERVGEEAESAIHWNKWAIWRSAWQDYNAQQQGGVE